MAKSDALIVNRTYKIERFDGKGGWHYVLLNEDLTVYKSKFGWVKVKGKVDETEINAVKLAPYGKGKAMFTLNADLRKKINKGHGDTIKLELYVDDSVAEIPIEILEVLAYFPATLHFFESLTESNKKFFTDHITDAKTEETKVKRLNAAIDKLLEKKKFYDY
jgi:Domain of unknown function (DUF1905)/Bacteriocin-protection, YdeI or OmpD-Associated